jgi:prevent-host-death family protein
MLKECAKTFDLKDDIHSLTDFKRRTPEFLAQLRLTGRPVVLTVNGRPEVVVQDVSTYQALLDKLDRLQREQPDKSRAQGHAAGRQR